MFAKLKKKIEEEVGDLGQLTSPLANPFGSGDRRVGGSTQGTNTPNNLGSRQSSLASLVDIHTQDEPTSPSPLANISLPVPLTPTPAVPLRATNALHAKENVEAELKKVNAEWQRKFDSMRKSFEERLQNQEADFAWKYGSKEEELEKLRAEKRKAEELIKKMEGSYQNKMTRVQDDMDQLEGFTKQEMAKVKHLLLNTQADLQKAQSEVMVKANLAKDLAEENKQVKAENETILRNLDRDRLNRVKFEAEQADVTTQIVNLQQEIQQRDTILAEARKSLEDSVSLANNLAEENNKLKAEKETALQNLEKEKIEFQNSKGHNQESFEAERAELSSRIEHLQNELQKKEESISEKCSSLDEALQRLGVTHEELEKLRSEQRKGEELMKKMEESYLNKITTLQDDMEQLEGITKQEMENVKLLLSNTQADLQKAQSEVMDKANLAKDLAEANKQLKAESETILQNLDRDRLNHVKFEAEAEHDDVTSQINNLQQEIQERDTAVAEARKSLEDSVNFANNLAQENNKLKTERETALQNLEKEKIHFQNFTAHTQESSEAERAELSSRIEQLQNELQKKEESFYEKCSSLNDALQQLAVTHEELENLRSEKQKGDDLIKKMEESYQNKMTRLQDDMDQMEGIAKQEMEKVKHLQKEIQERDTALAEARKSLEDSVSLANNLAEENNKLNAEKETAFQNFEKEKIDFQHFKAQNQESFEAERAELSSRIEQLQNELQKKETSFYEQGSSLDEALQQLGDTHEELKKSRCDLESVEKRCRDLEHQQEAATSRIQELDTELEKRNIELEEFHSKSNGLGAEEDVESFKERIRELEAKLNDKNKALKLRQQQLQDMRKTLAKEMKGNSATLLQPSEPTPPEYFSKSPSQNSLASSANDVRVEEPSQSPPQVDTEPAVIPSSNSHVESSYSYANDVNFQYMKSVIFKFVTSHDPQVTHHLTKVVATLLHLSDEESRILERCTDKRLLTWLGSRENQGF